LCLCIGYLRLNKFFRPSFRENIAICCLLIVSMLTLTSLPEALGLWLNQAAFDVFAKSVKKEYENWLWIPHRHEPPNHLGFMPIVRYAYEGDGGVYLTTTRRGTFDTYRYGYVYKPSPEIWTEENSRIRHSFNHLWGDWYTFEIFERFEFCRMWLMFSELWWHYLLHANEWCRKISPTNLARNWLHPPRLIVSF
jgi:hypothetical protein